jgi:hypothetical protein
MVAGENKTSWSVIVGPPVSLQYDFGANFASNFVSTVHAPPVLLTHHTIVMYQLKPVLRYTMYIDCPYLVGKRSGCVPT